MFLFASTGFPVIQQALDEIMLADDKLFVVLAVVLIIWVGIVAYICAVDRRLARLERALAEAAPTKSSSTAPDSQLTS